MHTMAKIQDIEYAIKLMQRNSNINKIDFELDVDSFVGYDDDGVEYEADAVEINGELVPDLDTVCETGQTMMDYDYKRGAFSIV